MGTLILVVCLGFAAPILLVAGGWWITRRLIQIGRVGLAASVVGCGAVILAGATTMSLLLTWDFLLSDHAEIHLRNATPEVIAVWYQGEDLPILAPYPALPIRPGEAAELGLGSLLGPGEAVCLSDEPVAVVRSGETGLLLDPVTGRPSVLVEIPAGWCAEGRQAWLDWDGQELLQGRRDTNLWVVAVPIAVTGACLVMLAIGFVADRRRLLPSG